MLEFRLTNQHDLQQLGIIYFQIGQQTQLFQHFRHQMLGFVDHQQRSPSGLMIPQQEVMQRNK